MPCPRPTIDRRPVHGDPIHAEEAHRRQGLRRAFGYGEIQEARLARIVERGPLDALRVAPKVTRGFEAGPECLELLAFGPHHEGDGEIIQGWWSD